MKKVSPLQANILKIMAVNETDDHYLFYDTSRGKISTRRVNHHREYLDGRSISLRSMQVLIDSKLVEEFRPMRMYSKEYHLTNAGRECLNQLQPKDFIFPAPPEYTEAMLTDFLRQKYDDENDGWVFYSQVRGSTGYTRNQQYLDGWAMNLWPSRRITAICFEIKVSKSDLMHELSRPLKRQYGLSVSNQFYFVVPKGLCSADIIPEECGLIEVWNDSEENTYQSRTVRKAPDRGTPTATWSFLGSVLRSAKKMEASTQEQNEKKHISGVLSPNGIIPTGERS